MNIYVAGHQGMVGSSIFRALSSDAGNNIITSTRDELNLLDQKSVHNYFKRNDFDQVYLAAAKVGGIYANNEFPAEFIYENLMIQANIISAAHSSGVNKLLFLGSSCIYPKYAKQPMREDALLTGSLESTNEPYAIAKIAGIKLCESYNRQYNRDYRSIMPTNLYGQNDNFHPKNSHVIPAMIDRFHKAKLNNDKEVIIWGSGSPMREFMHVDDMSSASIYVMNIDNKSFKENTSQMLSHINAGTGIEYSIKELANIISKIVGFKGKLIFDKSKPDGSPRKLMDSSKLSKLGWKPKISIEDGLKSTYEWFIKNNEKIRV